jgi:preprotein translocase subunit YajC
MHRTTSQQNQTQQQELSTKNIHHGSIIGIIGGVILRVIDVGLQI